MTLIPVMSKLESKSGATNSTAGANSPLPAKLYTCPMASHADVVSDHPGLCPKCEMELVETSTVAHGKQSEAVWRKQHSGGVDK
jgi:hypothetical protein